ncbi:MAG: hypothetical protein H7A35_15125 [Planctomycetales bacterium]|nr:hypothetical protein [bacterium]UNM08162.1 MAG: hypothetical protein H7A35_15125 [Planctomycetales bacterium]
MQIAHNKIFEHELGICKILASLAYHIHPKIAQRIADQNAAEREYFAELFKDKIDLDSYLFQGSTCVFPGVKRYVSGQGKRKSYNPQFRAIIDDNTFPRHIWCYLEYGSAYSGPKWKSTGLCEFELAHVFSHKQSELVLEQRYFSSINVDLVPNGDFTCACNVVLLPKGTVRPTDNSDNIKAAFFQRYIDLYGEESLNGRSGFRSDLVPSWYSELNWNEPVLVDNWKDNLSRLMKYRTKRITHLLTIAG